MLVFLSCLIAVLLVALPTLPPSPGPHGPGVGAERVEVGVSQGGKGGGDAISACLSAQGGASSPLPVIRRQASF